MIQVTRRSFWGSILAKTRNELYGSMDLPAYDMVMVRVADDINVDHSLYRIG